MWLVIIPHPTWALGPAVAIGKAIDDTQRKVSVLAHDATFLDDPLSEPNYHLKVTNISPGREIWISHIWFELDEDAQLHLLDNERPFPARLRRDEQYETWLAAAQAGGVPDWALRFRVKLTAGDVFASRLNKSVPAAGFVAGSGESPYSAPLSTTEPIGVTGVNLDPFKLARPNTSASAIFDPSAEQDEK